METNIEDGTAYGDARECIGRAKGSLREIKELLARPSVESAEQSATILREVEVQLGCAAAILMRSGSKPDLEIRSAVEELQDQVAVLSRFFGEAEKLFSGWLRTVQTKRFGYNEQGHAAQLVLVNRLTAEG